MNDFRLRVRVAALLALLLGGVAFDVRAENPVLNSAEPNAATVEIFRVFAHNTRKMFKSYNAVPLGEEFPECAAFIDGNSANTAQRDMIKLFKRVFIEIQAEENDKAEAAKKNSPRCGTDPVPVDPYLNTVLRYADYLNDVFVDGFNVGNCGEMASFTFANLYDAFPGVKFMYVGYLNSDHAFVLAKMANNEVYVIDSWKGEIGGPFRFQKRDGKVGLFKDGAPAPEWGEPLRPITDWEPKDPDKVESGKVDGPKVDGDGCGCGDNAGLGKEGSGGSAGERIGRVFRLKPGQSSAGDHRCAFFSRASNSSERRVGSQAWLACGDELEVAVHLPTFPQPTEKKSYFFSVLHRCASQNNLIELRDDTSDFAHMADHTHKTGGDGASSCVGYYVRAQCDGRWTPTLNFVIMP